MMRRFIPGEGVGARQRGPGGGSFPRWRGIRALIAVVVLTACGDDPTSVSSPGSEDIATLETSGAPTPAGGHIYSDRARVMDPASFELRSNRTELDAGRYRYRALDGTELPEVGRDDFVVGMADEPFVRLVLSSQWVGDELVLETGPALWSDVVQSGTYGVTVPLSSGDGVARSLAGVTLAPFTVGPLTGLPFGPMETDLPELDLCGLLSDLVALLISDAQVCGKPRSLDLSVGVSLTLEGTVDSLVVLGGHVAMEGDLDLAMEVDGGGITGGRAPTFSPCNRAAYRGCFNTPTGAALIDFLRQYAPQIPEASLPSIRVCVPGLPVRVRAGYWDRSGWLPRWVSPVYEKCTITDVGVLPDIVLPTVQTASNTVRPHVTGEMTIRIKGDGSLRVKIPIPSLGWSGGWKGDHLAASATAGLFVDLRAALKNGGGTVLVTFDETGVLTQTWTEAAGWDGNFDLTESDRNAQLLYFDNPDSIVVRAGALATVEAELCAALISCKAGSDTTSATASAAESSGGGAPATAMTAVDGGAEILGLTELAIKVKAGADLFFGAEINWSRSQVNPDDPLIDNHHYDVDVLTEVTFKAGLTIPLVGWAIPKSLKEWEHVIECCRVPVMDLWGTGRLQVVTNTTGGFPDPDGYTVLVSRFDTLPVIIDGGSTRVGKERDWGTALSGMVGITDSVEFSQVVPCGVYYSDVLVFLDPSGQLYLGLAGLRALGVNVPTYAITSRCNLLIARYNVELTDVAENCVVEGGVLRNDVWLLQVNHSLNRQDNLQRVEFTVDCSSSVPLGAVDLTVTTNGPPPDLPYRSTVDGVAGIPIGPNETLHVDGLAAGARVFGVTDVPVACTATTTSVTVAAGTTVAASVVVDCPVPVPGPGTVTVNAVTGGTGSDPDGFEVRVDGISRAPLRPTGTASVEGIPASVPTVIQVGGIAPHCRANTPNPSVVTLDASATPVTLDFTAECTTAAIDSVTGIVESTGWPNPDVSIRADDGTSVALRGGVLGEIAQLTGTTVRVWGVLSGLTLDVYHYGFRPSLTDPRWVGIVVVRPDGVWLMGDDAVLLVDPPPGLVSRVGALVWVTGTEIGGGIHPDIFGVLREAQP